MRVHTRNLVTGLSTSIAIELGFGAERYLWDTSKRNCLQNNFFPEPQGVVEAPDTEVSQGLQRWESATRGQKEIRKAIEM